MAGPYRRNGRFGRLLADAAESKAIPPYYIRMTKLTVTAKGCDLRKRRTSRKHLRRSARREG